MIPATATLYRGKGRAIGHDHYLQVQGDSEYRPPFLAKPVFFASQGAALAGIPSDIELMRFCIDEDYQS
jgi:hypothetical protein